MKVEVDKVRLLIINIIFYYIYDMDQILRKKAIHITWFKGSKMAAGGGDYDH